MLLLFTLSWRPTKLDARVVVAASELTGLCWPVKFKPELVKVIENNNYDTCKKLSFTRADPKITGILL